MALSALLCVFLAACGGGDDDENGDEGPLVVWTLEYEPDRVKAQEQMLAAYTEESGTEVKLRGIESDQLKTLTPSAAAGGTLPDVILGLDLTSATSLAGQQILDSEAAREVIADLGADTFSQRALDLVGGSEEPIAVPTDSYGNVIFYRTDLFKQAGLEPPTTFDALLTAAQTLDSDDVAGIVTGTAPTDLYTQETFETFAIANGCQLVDESDALTLDTPQCEAAFDLYTNLVSNYSTSGAQEYDTTRPTYLAGKAAMVVWSTFLLDELAGLERANAPTCAQCKDDPRYLADNTGVVTGFQGPDASEAAQYGDVTVFAITTEANPQSTDLVEYMMSDAYIDWISIAPEGKIPVRLGTEDDPRQYADEWGTLDVGVDETQPLDSVYSRQIVDATRAGAEQFDRWGFGHSPDGPALVGASASDLPITQAIADVVDGASDADDAWAEVVAQYEELQASIK